MFTPAQTKASGTSVRKRVTFRPGSSSRVCANTALEGCSCGFPCLDPTLQCLAGVSAIATAESCCVALHSNRSSARSIFKPPGSHPVPALPHHTVHPHDSAKNTPVRFLLSRDYLHGPIHLTFTPSSLSLFCNVCQVLASIRNPARLTSSHGHASSLKAPYQASAEAATTMAPRTEKSQLKRQRVSYLSQGLLSAQCSRYVFSDTACFHRAPCQRARPTPRSRGVPSACPNPVARIKRLYHVQASSLRP